MAAICFSTASASTSARRFTGPISSRSFSRRSSAAAGLLLGFRRELRRRIGHGGIGAEPFGDALRHRAPGLLGLRRRALRPHRVLARGAERGLGGTGGAIGFGGSRCRRRPGVGGGAVRRLGRLQRIQRLGAPRRDLRRAPPAAPHVRPLPRSRRASSSPTRAAASAARCAQSARSAAIAAATRRARGMLARQRLALRPRRRLRRAGGGQRGARLLHRAAQRAEIGQRGLRLRGPRASAVAGLRALGRQRARSGCRSPASRAAISAACARSC